jgi:lactoylglutathione lyase
MRILHTMLRVADLERSLHFYTEVLGMTLFRRHDFPEAKFTLAFVGYGDEQSGSLIELTHNHGVGEYERGDAFGHIAIEVDDVRDAVRDIRARGGVVKREPATLAGTDTLLAFVEDPDGYAIELLGPRS